MDERLTDELLEELLSAPDPAKFADDRGITGRTLSQYLEKLLDEKGLERASVVREAGLNSTYGYEIFTGKKTHPSRDIVLQLAFALGCTLTEANRALQAAGHNELYCKTRRDAIIIFCIDRGCSLQETNEQLYSRNEPTIGSDS